MEQAETVRDFNGRGKAKLLLSSRYLVPDGDRQFYVDSEPIRATCIIYLGTYLPYIDLVRITPDKQKSGMYRPTLPCTAHYRSNPNRCDPAIEAVPLPTLTYTVKLVLTSNELLIIFRKPN